MLKRSRRHAGETSIHDLPDELLTLVLLRASSSISLIRAAAACKPWRRVIAGGGGAFLRRFGRLHPPHVLGHYYDDRRPCEPIFVPSPTSPGEAAVDVDDRVSLDFIDHHYDDTMELSESRGSLLAFAKAFSTVVVCDPWTREQREITPPSSWNDNLGRTIGAFLLAGGGDEADTGVDMSCFRVLCVSLVRDHDNGNKTAWATMFSARHGRWISLGSRDVDAIIPDHPCWFNARTKFLGRAGGSLCWSGHVGGAVLHLDEGSGTFSTFTLPADVRRFHWSAYQRENLRVVGGGGSTGSVRLARILGDDLEVLRWSRGGGDECMVEGKVCLSRLAGIEEVAKISWRFMDTAETVNPGHVVLSPDRKHIWVFSVNGEIMMLKRSVERKKWHASRVFPYELPWPPTIKVCV